MIKIIERGKYEQIRCNGCNALLRFNWSDVSGRWTIKCPCCQDDISVRSKLYGEES